MVEGMAGRGEGDSITAASAAYLNNPVERTAHTRRFLLSVASVPLGRPLTGSVIAPRKLGVSYRVKVPVG
jgi:hypothetical protein